MSGLMKAITLFTILCAGSHAATSECTGQFRGRSVVLKAYNINLTNFSRASGVVIVDGRQLAQFERKDTSVNLLLWKVSTLNSFGESVSGKLLNRKGDALVTRINIPSYGVDFRNFPLKCRTF